MLSICRAAVTALCAFCLGAATLPPGFEETRVASGLVSPTTMAFAPDGRLFILQQSGEVIVVKNGQTLPLPAIRLAVDSTGERGLLGIAFHPQFSTNSQLYLYYTVAAAPARNRVSRFSMTGDVIAAGSEAILLEIPLAQNAHHNGGSMAFGADGKLYVATGDAGTPSNAQALDNLKGKILRLNADGTIPGDNPFQAATGSNRAIWALGFRNPFQIAVQPGAGRIHINDVGQESAEEINEGVAGANYGWPLQEGFGSGGGFRNPVYAYSRNVAPGGCAITGGAFYSPNAPRFPVEYTNAYFFSDFCSGWIQSLHAGEPMPRPFATGVSWPVAIQTAPDGSLYYLARGGADLGLPTGEVYRIVNSSTGVPSIGAPPASQLATVGEPVTFQATVSGRAPMSYQWLRNGAAIPGATGLTYRIASVTLADNNAQFQIRATNSSGSTTSDPAVLTVTTNRRPTGVISAPAAGAHYAGGEVIAFAAVGTDPETGALPPEAFTWRVDFHHDSHWHPFLPPRTGIRSGSFTVPTTGETSPSVWYRVNLTVTDTAGLTHSSFVDVQPRLTNISIATNPPGLVAILNGIGRITPFIARAVIGVQHEVTLPTPQVVGPTSYTFTGWSNGRPLTQTFSAPATGIALTANFRAASLCPIALDQTVIRVPALGASGTVRLNAASDCVWSAGGAFNLVSVFPMEGSGPAKLTYSAKPNFSTGVRSAAFNIGGANLTFEQAGALGTENERFVAMLYWNLLGRQGAPADIQFHVRNGLNLGVTRSALVANFVNGGEFLSTSLYVVGLYVGILGRDPEYAGWLFQRSALTSGQISHLQQVSNFIGSPEFQLNHPNLSDEGLIRLLYRNVLRREPGSDEVVFHLGTLTRGLTRAQMASNILLSSEFHQTSGPRLLAFMLYAGLLGRGASSEEIVFRAEQIRVNGLSWTAEQILRSSEFSDSIR